MGSLLEDIKLGKRYVYFRSQENTHGNSLYAKTDTILQELKIGITASSDKLDENKSKTKMDLALDFLKTAATTERTKEVRFFQNFNSQFPEMQKLFNMDFNQETMEKDYINFIANINKTLKGTETFKKELQAEIKRIERYNNSRQYTRKGEIKKGFEGEYQKAVTENSAYYNAAQTIFQKNSKKSFESLINNRTTESEITNYILKNFGNKIFSMGKNGKLQLDSTQFASLIKLLNDKAYEMLQNQFDQVKKYEVSSHFNNKDFLQEYDQFINGLLDSPNLGDTLSSVADQFGITPSRMQNITVQSNELETVKNKLMNATESLRNGEDFDTWFSHNQGLLNLEDIVKASYSISVQGYYTGEDLGLVELATKHIVGILGGRSNPTDDIEAGKLIVIPTVDVNTSSAYSKYESAMLQIQKKYFNQIKRTTDLNSFRENTETLKAMREEQLKALKDLESELPKGEKGLKYLIEHINLHDTIKGYASAGSANFQKNGGFEGAAFGSNLEQQLSILSSTNIPGGLSMMEGLSQEDINFFRFAMVNAGSKMIGASLKKSLEDYFSVFLGFFMFNDAALMVEDAKNTLEETMEPQVTELHVYQLNGVYIPSSYLLQQTWEQLTKAVQDMETTALSGQGTRAILHTYDKEYTKGMTPEQMFDQAEKSTKLEMRFLGGFFDLLGSISNAMNNLG